ncbi:MAG: hypothetical protein EPO32_12985, partial [Anaerolineae bacterium]
FEQEGQNPLLVMPSAPAQDSRAGASGGENLEDLLAEWLAACRRFDERAAEQVATTALSLYPVETVLAGLFQKGLARIGDGWYRGEVTVQQEHFASALALRRLDALIAAAALPTRRGRILLACPPKEDHTFSALMLTLLLRRKGWDVVYLGANVPVQQLAQTIEQVAPKLVVLTAMHLQSAASLMEMAEFVKQFEVPVVFGGLAFNRIEGLAQRIHGEFLGDNLLDAVGRIEQAIEVGITEKKTTPQTKAVKATRDMFRERRAQIDARMRQQEGGPVGIREHLPVANGQLGNDIDAALSLGGMPFLGEDVEWIRAYLENLNIPPAALSQYLHAYAKAVKAEMGEAGTTVAGWLDDRAGALVST